MCAVCSLLRGLQAPIGPAARLLLLLAAPRPRLIGPCASEDGARGGEETGAAGGAAGSGACAWETSCAQDLGFPWWPAQVLGPQLGARRDEEDEHASRGECGSSSLPPPPFPLPVSQTGSFLESFQSRFDRMRRGPYRRAVTEARALPRPLVPPRRCSLTAEA
ncbi:unnamed protein product [Lota lota]